MKPFRRIHFVELHDLDGTPRILRALHTESSWHMYRLFKAGKEYANLVSRALHLTNGQQKIIDLCAGSGGPLPFAQRELHQQGIHTQVTLTDLVPNVTAMRQSTQDNERLFGHDDCCKIDSSADSVDATAVREKGMRTIFNAFHHFRPELGKRILQNAVDSKSPILIVDTPRSLFNIFVLPFMSTLSLLLMTPAMWAGSPSRYFLRLLLTYVIPVLPFMMFWDSTVSYMRMYSRTEMFGMIDQVNGSQDYNWVIDFRKGMFGLQYTKNAA
jgi:hypothetical protein